MVLAALPQPLPGFGSFLADRCRICDRPLTNPLSMMTGIGPVCAARYGIARTAEKEEQEDDDMHVLIDDRPGKEVPVARFIPDYPVGHDDIVLTRRPDGTAEASIPKVHRHHDTTDDIEFGYMGSGPADLALNILARYLPPTGTDDTVPLWDGSTVSRDAWDLHQSFKSQVVAAVPFDGATIPADLIRNWIARNTNGR